MKKITLFFCDICGTFTEGNSLEIDRDLIKRFVYDLDGIRKLNGSDEVIFSFITTEDLSVVLSMERKLAENIVNKNIMIGSHFCDGVNHSVIHKPFDIFNYINDLKKHYIIDQIYYADDCEFYHVMLKELETCYDIDCCIHSIIPEGRGLIEVNSALEKILFSSGQKQKIRGIH